METTIGNLGDEVHQHSNPYANLAERALLRAQLNVLKAIQPEFDTDHDPHPRGSFILKNSYVLQRARDTSPHEILDPEELETLHDFLVQHNLPLISSLFRWAQLHLPNGEIVRCAWKELENRNTRTSCNVQFKSGNFLYYGEVQYFFCLTIVNRKRAFALISHYSEPDPELLEQSHDTLYIARYQGKQALEIVNVYSIRLVIGMVPFMLSQEEEDCAETRDQYSQCFFVAENPAMLFSAADENEQSEDNTNNTSDEDNNTSDDDGELEGNEDSEPEE
ncbi:hypothetical protein JOM56_012567 [Amanita muscaria]